MFLIFNSSKIKITSKIIPVIRFFLKNDIVIMLALVGIVGNFNTNINK